MKGEIQFGQKLEKYPATSPYPAPASGQPRPNTVPQPGRMTADLDLNDSVPQIAPEAQPVMMSSIATPAWPKRRPPYNQIPSSESAGMPAVPTTPRTEQGFPMSPTVSVPYGEASAALARATSASSASSHHPSQSIHRPSPPQPTWSENPATQSPQSMHDVYVVHHDAGAAPVTVYTRPGSRVTELPPGYQDRQHDQSSSSAAVLHTRHSQAQLALVSEPETPISPSSPVAPTTDRKSTYHGSSPSNSYSEQSSYPLPSPAPLQQQAPSPPPPLKFSPPILGPSSPPPDFDALSHDSMIPNPLPQSSTSPRPPSLPPPPAESPPVPPAPHMHPRTSLSLPKPAGPR